MCSKPTFVSLSQLYRPKWLNEWRKMRPILWPSWKRAVASIWTKSFSIRNPKVHISWIKNNFYDSFNFVYFIQKTNRSGNFGTPFIGWFFKFWMVLSSFWTATNCQFHLTIAFIQVTNAIYCRSKRRFFCCFLNDASFLTCTQYNITKKI